MADLSLVTADKLSLVESIEQMTAICSVAITAGNAITIDPTTGQWVKADANVGDLDKPVYIAMKTIPAGLAVTGIKQGVVDGIDLSSLDYAQGVFLSATLGALATEIAGVTETQVLTLSGSPSGGSFKLSFRGEETTALTYDESAADIQTALRALATIGADGCTVGGSGGGPWTVTFAGELLRKAVPMLVLSTNALTGGSSPSVGIAEGDTGVSRHQVGYVIPANNQTLGNSPDKLLRVGP